MDWVKKIEQLSSAKSKEPEGDGWFTALEFREKGQIGYSRCYKLIREARENGKLEVFNGCAWNPELQQLVRRVWYRFISPK